MRQVRHRPGEVSPSTPMPVSETALSAMVARLSVQTDDDAEIVGVSPDRSGPPRPHFAVNLAELRRNYRTFTQTLPGAEVFYAVKANADPAVLSYLARLGSGFEAASWGEIELLLSLGVGADRIIFGTAVKAPHEIARAHAAGVDRYAADSAEEIVLLGDCAPASRVFVRVKLGPTGSIFEMNEKFGALPDEAARLVRLAKEAGLVPWGLSINVGSQATDARAWADGVAVLSDVLRELSDTGVRLSVLNLGGGFPVAYAAGRAITLGEIADHLRPALEALPYAPRLLVEPGRAIVASAVSLVATVISRIERPTGPWLFLDCGVYNALYEALAHQGRTQYQVALSSSPRPISKRQTSYVIAGPTGDGLDVVARDVALPDDIVRGDTLTFRNVGAYTRCMASTFNGFPVPSVVVQEAD